MEVPHVPHTCTDGRSSHSPPESRAFTPKYYQPIANLPSASQHVVVVVVDWTSLLSGHPPLQRHVLLPRLHRRQAVTSTHSFRRNVLHSWMAPHALVIRRMICNHVTCREGASNKCAASPPTTTCNHDVTEWRTCSQWTLRIPSLPSVFWSAKSINKKMLSKYN